MKSIHNFYEFNAGKSNYLFHTTGDIFSFTNGNTMINQFRGNPKDGSANNIYLRIYKDEHIKTYPLLGIQSNSTLKKGNNTLVYSGNVEGITYEVTFKGLESLWYWDISLNGKGELIDLLYGQDIGIGSIGGVLTNELYIGQYLGHKIFQTRDQGYVICSRQNQDQGKEFPYIQQGALGIQVEHYLTDGLQFFETSYKSTNTPALLDKDLPDVNYQFEFSYIGLQTVKFTLDNTKNLAFYGYFMEDHPLAITTLEDTDLITNTYKNLAKEEVLMDCTKVELKHNFGKPYASRDLDNDEIFQLFKDHCLEEYDKDTLLSFFTNKHSHVVTKQKELLTERPHGTILTTPINTKNVNSNLITSTNYMYGIFNGQTVIGNTSFHKFISTPRGLLNIQKNCGQHLYVKIDDTYRLLTLPALYEMGMNYSKWYYALPEDMLIVTAFTTAKETSVVLEVSSTNKISYDFILTNQLVMGEVEYQKEITSTTIPEGLRFTMDSTLYPGLHYDIQFPEVFFTASDDRIFFTDDMPRDESFLTISIKDETYFQCIITGSLQEAPVHTKAFYSLEKENELYQEFYKQLNGNFHLSSTDLSMNTNLSVLNQTAWWYSHNAMVHFSVPHGLEQPGGAAWGTRDVCQGPMEYFLMTQHYELAKNILLNIFSHQQNSTGEWPQWFMFDRYQMDAGECHGDVVFWPLKCISDYLDACNDYSILLEMLPYSDKKESPETLLQHLKRAYAAITERFIGTTGLITYAGGDWDDTLQPADPVMKEHLISSWTVALAYQTLLNLSKVMKVTDDDFSNQLNYSANQIKKDFSNLMIKDGVIAGFLRQEEDDFHTMLHPSDSETGIQYRLIPMTRSIIAELVTKDQAHKNMDIIDKELKCPDGVRLMNKPAKYNGGVSKLFKRAEQAANVGREISLQYTHAHIRYIEACAKMGMAEEAWNSLFTINPIQIQKVVPNACRRQSNMYFSSSEGLYMDRYEYEKDFHLLKEGTIPVKGGWRLYSSGPGIYLNQLISNVLGIRFAGDYLILDPVLPSELDNLSFTYNLFGKTFTLNYHIGSNTKTIVKCKDIAIPSQAISNPYREGGIKIHKEVLENCYDALDIYL